MSESYKAGSQLREFLRGLLGAPEVSQSVEFTGDEKSARRFNVEWGPRVNLTGLRELFAPQEVKPFTAPPGGIDNLGLHSTDIFMIPGHGEFTVDFSGYFRVARSHPTTKEWASSEVRVNIVDLKLFGQHEGLGEVAVSLNPDILSSGQIFATTAPDQPKKCRIATGAIFDLKQLGVSVFNKEPILLMNEHVTRIPPVDDPNGHALLFNLPLYNRKDPEGEPVAYLTSLRYGADHYLSETDVKSFQMDNYVTESEVRTFQAANR